MGRIAAVLLVLVPVTAAPQNAEPPNPLTSVKGLKCRFPAATSAAWKNGEVVAQTKTQGAVNQFATKSVSENAVTRNGIKSTAERLNIAPVLPDRDVIGDQADAMRDLEARSGADFNQAYLDRVIQVRKDLIDEIDDALEKGGVRQEPVRKFLSEVRVNLDAARTAAEEVRAKQG